MPIMVFDIDGTLADIEHRRHFVRSKPTNWRAFFAGIPNDAINDPVAYMYWNSIKAQNCVILASGRGEETREATESWLSTNGLVGYSKLYMRRERDYRPDDIVKKEILDQIIQEYGKPDVWFDDRPKVVKMLRNNGVFVVDVYQGEEDF